MASDKFTLGQLLTAADLNAAFDSTLDLTDTGSQTLQGTLNLQNLNAVVGVKTAILQVSGNAVFLAGSALRIPVGSTLNRQQDGNSGWFQINTDSGLPEILMPSGRWVNLQTATAVQSPAQPPVSMGAVTFGQASGTSLGVSWSPPVGGTAPFTYTVQYRLAGTANWISFAIDIVAQTTMISGLLQAARYEIQVIVKNIAGSATSPVSATNTLGFVAGGPTNLSAFNGTSTSVSLSWTPVSSSVPVAYIVQYSTVAAPTWQTFGTPLDGTSTTVTGLSSNTTYNFQVIAKTSGGSFDSLATQGSTAVGAIAAPSQVLNIAFSSITTSSMTAAWSAPTSGTSPFVYQLQYQVNSGTVWNNYGPATTSSSLNLVNLNSGFTYSFRVTATNSLGTSLSNPFPVTLLTTTASTGLVADYQTSGTTFPIITGPQIGTVMGGSVIDVNGLNVLDPSAAFLSGSMSLGVKCGIGAVSMTDGNGNQIIGSGTSNIAKFPTTLSGVRAALNTLAYSAPSTSAAFTDNVIITVSDQAFQTSTLSVNLSVLANSSTGPSPTPSPIPPPAPSGGHTSTGQPSDTAGVQAINAKNFITGIGVRTKFTGGNYGPDFSPNTAAIIENTLNFFPGLSFVKETGYLNTISQGPFLQQIAQNTGIQYFFEVSSDQRNTAINNQTAWQNALNNIAQFSQFYGNYLLGIQGVNLGAFTQNGVVVDQFSYNQGISFQTNVTQLAHALGISSVQQELLAPPTQLIGNSDFGLLDVFPDSAPSAGRLSTNPTGYLGDSYARTAITTPNAPIFLQWGYQSYPDGASAHMTGDNVVDETTQAKYLAQALFDAIYTGVTFNAGRPSFNPAVPIWECWYELFDTPTSSFGLFTGYGGTPKLSGRVLSYFMNLFFDGASNASSFVTGFLNYTVTNKPAHTGIFLNTGYKEMLLQSSNGTWFLIMSNEQVLNTPGTDTRINVPNTAVNITFNERTVTQVQVYDPFGSAGGFTSSPIAVLNNVNTMNVSLPAYPIVLVIFP